MEKRIFVKDLQLHQEVFSLFQILEVDLRKTRTGEHYIAMKVGDNTGKIPLRIWSATEELFRSFSVGELLALKGIRVSEYQGKLQLSINREQLDRISTYPLDHFHPQDFIETTQKDPQAMLEEIMVVIGKIQKEGLKELLLSFFQDDVFVKGFRNSPAAVAHHHTFCGGLLEHTTSVLHLCLHGARNYQVDTDQLCAGAILHDIGKIQSYTYKPTIQMTTEGRLFSHIVLGVKMLDDRIKGSSILLPQEDYYRLQHMLISHHGKMEWGSPVEPVTLEAILLHQCDYLDAQAQKYEGALRQEDLDQGEWSQYYPKIGSRLFLGLHQEEKSLPEMSGTIDR